MKSLGLIGFAALAVSLAGCRGGNVPTQEQIDKLNFSMTLDQVESILGPGRDIDPPSQEPHPGALDVPPDLREKAFPPPPAWVVAREKSANWKRWGNDAAHLCLGFSNGKIVGSRIHDIGGTIKRDPNAPEMPRSILPDDFLAQARKSSRYLSELSELGFSIRDYAGKNPTATPDGLATLAAGFFPISPEVKDLVQSGEIVVFWNAPKGRKILAYPKMALEANARYLDGQGDLQDSTPALIKQLLDEQK